MMDLIDAMKFRHAVREYSDTPIEKEIVEELKKFIDECNRESGLKMQLILDEPVAFECMTARYGKFENVRNYIAMVGADSPDLEKKIGYYGQKVVLRAVQLGLGTCWAAIAFGKRKNGVEIKGDEKFVCSVTVGNYINAGVPHESKSIGEVSSSDGSKPEWFDNGVRAALLAPTAMNQQKFHLSLEGNKVSAKTDRGQFTKLDLGIIKYNFELGAGKGDWEWSDN